MAGNAGCLSLAKKLLRRTLAQYTALGTCCPKLKMSCASIEDWFNNNRKHSGPEKYQPSTSSLYKLVSGADSGRHRTVKNVLALRMWMEQHNDKLPQELQDTSWGVPEWYNVGVSDMQIGCYDDVNHGDGAAAAAAAPASPPRSARKRHASQCPDRPDMPMDDLTTKMPGEGMSDEDEDDCDEGGGGGGMRTPTCKATLASTCRTVHKKSKLGAPTGHRKLKWWTYETMSGGQKWTWKSKHPAEYTVRSDRSWRKMEKDLAEAQAKLKKYAPPPLALGAVAE